MIPSLRLSSLRDAWDSGEWTPTRLIESIDDAIIAAEPSAIWISRFSREQLLDFARAVEVKGREAQPLYGVPFAIKDNIDVCGLPTTAACPGFAYEAEESAFVVETLIEAGAIPIGKTNLDQFATGLVGLRSPYGVPENAFHPDYIPGGSSSGSAVAVARGFVSFALGTDTAGSGRVPAAFNNLVGHKPTRGLLSCRGVVPACRTLDCVSIFAHSATEASEILDITARYDPNDDFARPRESCEAWSSRFRFGVPRSEDLEFFGNIDASSLFANAIERLEQIGGEPVEVDFQPFLKAARLLYDGPWIAERFVAIEEILSERPEILHPVTRKIIEAGAQPSAAAAFKAEYQRRYLKRRADEVLKSVDFIASPTAGTLYTRKEVEADPVQLNSNLGYYTNFMNLLDYAATAVPVGFQPNGLPFGITIFGPAFCDWALLDVAARFIGEVENEWTHIVVCGAHMKDLPLNHQLTDRGGRFLRKAKTASVYRLHALPAIDNMPPRPGMLRVRDQGVAVEVEIWSLPLKEFGDFVRQIPAPLGIGQVQLSDGTAHPGFLCEPIAMDEARDISHLADWRHYLTQ